MTIPLAVTTGDPAGVGPELIVRLLDELRGSAADPLVVVSSREELAEGLERSGLAVALDGILEPGRVRLVEPAGSWPSARGAVSAASGRWALACLERGLELHAAGEIGGLVFGPLNKTSLHEAGMTEPDEMRWFENRLTGSHTASEVNVTTSFWTSRVTSHVALREVADLVTSDRVLESIVLLHDLLVGAGTPAPRIAVCALNPHAGEHGLFGDEEITRIRPGVERAVASGLDAAGPFPCDTLFRRGFDGSFDGIVTMYHDQGQIALKTRAFNGGVTLEAGLDLPICTPAHGTAFDIVGTGAATLDSTRNAYRLARRLASAGVSAH
ncbi:PdxA family dehydrogenase [Rathayibacter festucae]|uniref:4-hydroxythreonine-4-phosphate dehydrogenase n=1 Tax=Rathayibacter festucae DSM 15932 TaxID=1328866 RepID=A0A3Q9UZX8_9MICO|nr:4-hydroxythreonine-4-phosphate dehydrogenase PdxA [Rathayibacter festucae]AZZ54204.1 4-hydroxythreonine-4-phosphate dehydrogenase [Rathayibacter festucae DSM 15932]